LGLTTRPNNGRTDVIFFDDLAQFTKAVEAATGLVLDFVELLQLNTNFVEQTDQYLILNVKEDSDPEPNNLMFLRAEGSLIFTKRAPRPEAFREFERLYSRPFGRSTVLAFVVLNKALLSYQARLDGLAPAIRELDQNFDQARYRELLSVNDRLQDRLEDFHELLVRLQERAFKQVETRYLSFDWNVLITETQTLLDRVRRRLNNLRELARDQEYRASAELNRRIEHLNVVLRRLTALTIIIAVPTLVVSHFGMNFRHMPELGIWWAYPAVVAGEITLIIGAIIWFRKVGWL
jgi:Mg2+ and Co2+ transporter CorA